MPARRMSIEASRIDGSLVSFRIISFIPKIAFMGVRISCEVLARKSLFARLAALVICVECSALILASSRSFSMVSMLLYDGAS